MARGSSTFFWVIMSDKTTKACAKLGDGFCGVKDTNEQYR
jgi:hypothetical protein